MEQLIEDVQAALDQMNRNLSEIAQHNKRQTAILEQMARKLGVNLTDSNQD